MFTIARETRGDDLALAYDYRHFWHENSVFNEDPWWVWIIPFSHFTLSNLLLLNIFLCIWVFTSFCIKKFEQMEKLAVKAIAFFFLLAFAYILIYTKQSTCFCFCSDFSSYNWTLLSSLPHVPCWRKTPSMWKRYCFVDEKRHFAGIFILNRKHFQGYKQCFKFGRYPFSTNFDITLNRFWHFQLSQPHPQCCYCLNILLQAWNTTLGYFVAEERQPVAAYISPVSALLSPENQCTSSNIATQIYPVNTVFINESLWENIIGFTMGDPYNRDCGKTNTPQSSRKNSDCSDPLEVRRKWSLATRMAKFLQRTKTEPDNLWVYCVD